jgi:hypothetical protein
MNEEQPIPFKYDLQQTPIENLINMLKYNPTDLEEPYATFHHIFNGLLQHFSLTPHCKDINTRPEFWLDNIYDQVLTPIIESNFITPLLLIRLLNKKHDLQLLLPNETYQKKQYISPRLIWENLLEAHQRIPHNQKVEKITPLHEFIKLCTLNQIHPVLIGNNEKIYETTCQIDLSALNPFKVASRHTDDEIKAIQTRYPNTFPLAITNETDDDDVIALIEETQQSQIDKAL